MDEPAEMPDVAPELLAAVEEAVGTALATPPANPQPPDATLAEAVPTSTPLDPVAGGVGATSGTTQTVQAPDAQQPTETITALASEPAMTPIPRPAIVAYDSMEIELAVIDPDPAPPEQEIVTRASSTGNRLYGVSLGRYPSRFAAEQLLLRTALAELGTFDEALRNVVQRTGGYEAQFAGMSFPEAERACARLMSRNLTCTTYGP